MYRAAISSTDFTNVCDGRRAQDEVPIARASWRKPTSQNVPDLVASCAARDPSHIALAKDASVMTYAELDCRANQLAHHLRRLGIGPDLPVGICLPRSPMAAVAALGTLKAGGAYLPVDVIYPRDRLSFILHDADVSVLISDKTVADKLPLGNWSLVLVDGDADILAQYPNVTPQTTIRGEHLAYVIYTSGSTGTPKGVQISHDSLLNLVVWHQRTFAITSDDRATQLASFGFDAAVWELWPYLVAGAAVYVTPDAIRTSPELLRDWLVGQKISITFIPTSLTERMLLLDWPPETNLRFLLTGADTLHHYPRPGLPFRLINNYGPTEATVVATSGLIAPESHADGRPPIGKPVDNVQIYILDESGVPVNTGEVGELYIGGAGVARGYVNSPELTAQRFLADPFNSRPESRLYRTGDLARFLPDGQIAYIGRTDDLIKIRGYRIEPNEIVSILNTHRLVEASTVLAREDRTGNLCLLAYVVVHADSRPTSSALRSLLRKQLPDYMVPAIFIGLDALPLTPNGKIDRESLPHPNDTNQLPEDDDYSAAQTILQQKLSKMIGDLLGLERVGINDNFFLIGGHSLFGTQLIARIRDSFGIEVPLRTIFDMPTTAQLATEIEDLIAARVDCMSAEELQLALRHTKSPGGQ